MKTVANRYPIILHPNENKVGFEFFECKCGKNEIIAKNRIDIDIDWAKIIAKLFEFVLSEFN